MYVLTRATRRDETAFDIDARGDFPRDTKNVIGRRSRRGDRGAACARGGEQGGRARASCRVR